MKTPTPQEPLQLNQIALFSAITKEVERQAKAQGLTLYVKSRFVNALITAANVVVDEYKKGEVLTHKGMAIWDWWRSDDTGASSKFMAITLDPGPNARSDKYNYPHDPDDFGRCWRLLNWVIPEKKADLHKLAETGPEWKALVEHWPLLEALFEADQYEQLYDRMKALTTKPTT